MTLFDENVSVVPAPRQRWRRGTVVGVWSLTIAVIVLFVMTFLPSAYVIQQPGPVYNTLGTTASADGQQVPLITCPTRRTPPVPSARPADRPGERGNREHTPSWIELASAWFDSSRAVVPIDRIFPAGRAPSSATPETPPS